jgi:hypothetical protein
VRKNPIAICAMLAVLNGCNMPHGFPRASAKTTPPFNAEEASYIFHRGANTIIGQAMTRRPNGEIATCHGDAATLAPDTRYTKARLATLYDGRDTVEIQDAPRLPRDSEYEHYVRHARCSHGGHFRFSHVADGDYVVIAALRSQHDSREQGVSIREEVSVHGGETRRVRLGD